MITEKNIQDIEVLEISNGHASVAVSTKSFARIVHYGLEGSENILGLHPAAEVATDLGVWKPLGGHRLWMAPENMPLSYAPDASLSAERRGELSVSVAAERDAASVEKRITVTLAESGSTVTVEHELTNRGEPREMSAWALTIMAPGGEAVIPNEPFAPYSGETLLPVRSMAVWSYTDLTDPRWTFTKDEIRIRVDGSLGHQQKIGVLNKQGWAGYRLDDLFFKKTFGYVDGAAYPDLNSNTEVYTAGTFVEVESLSPLKMLHTGESLSHTETWELTRGSEFQL